MSVESSNDNGSNKTGAQQIQVGLRDMPKIAQASKQIVLIAPYTTLYQQMYIAGVSVSGEILGADDALAKIVKIEMQRGRFISYLDGYSFYTAIGAKLAEKIREKGVDPMGKQIQVGKNLFTIIGIVKPWQPNLFLFADIDNGAIVPIDTSYLVSSGVQINNIMFRLVKNPDLDAVKTALTTRMSQLFPSMQVQFRDPQQII